MTIFHNFSIKIFSEIIKFMFEFKTFTLFGFSLASLYWTYKDPWKRYFTEAPLINVFSYLRKNATFRLATLSLNKILAFLWRLTQLHSEQTYFFIFKSKYVQQLISLGYPRACRYHSIPTLLNDICTLNGELELFPSFRKIYPK